MAQGCDALRSYARPYLPAFRLAIRALAAVYSAPPDLKASQLRGLLENASRLLARFGLDPVASQTITVPPAPPTREELEEEREWDELLGDGTPPPRAS